MFLTCDYLAGLMVPFPELSILSAMSSSDSLEVFLSLKVLSSRSRYLAVLMLEDGLFTDSTVAVPDGVKALAKRFGYSPASYIRSVRELVAAGLLIQGKQLTKGRPIITYRLSAEFSTIPYKGSHADRAKHALLADSLGLSIPERVLLADLWLGLCCKTVWGSAKSCVVDGVSLRMLAKRLGQGKATLHRVLGALEVKGFIFSDRGSFDRESRDGVSNTYYLLGPASTQGLEVVELGIELAPQIVRFLDADSGSSAVSEAFGSRALAQSGVLDNQLAWLESIRARVRLIKTLCVALSNDPSWLFERLMGSVLLEAEQHLLRGSGFRSLAGIGYRGLENMGLVVGHEEEKLFDAIKFLSGELANTMCFSILASPVVLRFLRRCKGKRYFIVSLVEAEGFFYFKVILVCDCSLSPELICMARA